MRNKVISILQKRKLKMLNFSPLEFNDFYNSVVRYTLTIMLYTITINENYNFSRENIDNIEKAIQETQRDIKIYNDNSEYFINLVDFYYVNKQKIQTIILQILSKYDEYKNVIDSKIQKANFDSVTKIIQCVFILSYFEIKEIRLKKEQVISNYLTIINIFNFTKKEIGFTNKIIDMF